MRFKSTYTVGVFSEFIARLYLRLHGFKILKSRYITGRNTHRAEIDIIAQQRNVLVFVEVKSRTSEEYGNAYDAVDDKKIRLLISAAQAYIRKYNIDLKFRFDIITVIGNSEPYRIEHIEDAFYPEW